MAKVGRPRMYDNANQMSLNVSIYKSDADVRDASDGILPYHDIDLKNQDFNTENELQKYIMLNADLFAEQYLNDTLIEAIEGMNLDTSHKSDIQKRKRRGCRVADIVMRCKNNNYLIELKNPKTKSENRSGIGQILDYGRDFLYPKKELLLISTVFDINTAKTIKHYNLPIRYFYMNKDQILEYMGDA